MSIFSAIRQAITGPKQPQVDTALHEAARTGNIAEVERLLAAGAPPDQPDQRLRTPLTYAAEGEHLEIAKSLLDRGANAAATGAGDPFEQALTNRHVPMIELLVARGADVNRRNVSYGWTPLHIHAKSALVVQTLLALGADSTARDAEGNTPLLDALGESEAAALLLERGADIEEKNKKGETLLHLAAAKNLPETVKVLLSRGAKIEARTGEGGTPLHVAIFSGNPEIAALLLDAGAEINALNANGWSPLLLAVLLAGLRDEDVSAGISLLLARGADTSIQDSEGVTAYKIATSISPNAKAAALLREHGVGA